MKRNSAVRGRAVPKSVEQQVFDVAEGQVRRMFLTSLARGVGNIWKTKLPEFFKCVALRSIAQDRNLNGGTTAGWEMEFNLETKGRFQNPI
jgi:hypothetical protein